MESQRALDHQDAVLAHVAHAGRLALFIGARTAEVAHRPVDAVDDVGLRLVGCRGKGEVGVAARLEEQRNLVVDAARAAVVSPIGQGPVTVDEGVAKTAVRIPGQMPVLGEQAQRLFELGSQAFPRVPLVVQVQLDLAQSRARQLGQRLEKLWPVLFTGEEERVSWGQPIGVAEVPRQRRVAIGPGLHARAALGSRGITKLRFIKFIRARSTTAMKMALGIFRELLKNWITSRDWDLNRFGVRRSLTRLKRTSATIFRTTLTSLPNMER